MILATEKVNISNVCLFNKHVLDISMLQALE